MDLDRMLERCVRDQWDPSDLDFSEQPRDLGRADEESICQLFTDMAGIERLAAELFREQERRVEDPTLKTIFASFVKDETRHAQVAQMLAAHYDVHHYRPYRMNPSLAKFSGPFVNAIRYLTDDVANAYVTSGELILDIALLRSIDDFVHDKTSHEAMRLINRDESRHIAVDYHMAEYYASDEFARRLAAERAPSLGDRARAWAAFAGVIYRAKPFFRDVFFEPMSRVDPSGKRLKEAFKRLQLLGQKPSKNIRPFAQFMLLLQELFHRPLVGTIFGGVISRLMGVDRSLIVRMYDREEVKRARSMTYDALAEEALAVKSS